MCGFDQIISYILCTEYIILQDRTKNLIYILQNQKKKTKIRKNELEIKKLTKRIQKWNQKPKINQKDTKMNLCDYYLFNLT